MCRFVRLHALSRLVLPLLAVALYARDTRCQETASALPNRSAEAAPAADDQVVVLRDGGVLSGRVDRDGENYLVVRGGSELRLDAARIEGVWSSLEEAYGHRRRQLPRPTAEGHLGLAEWCLSNDLVSQARSELSQARALDERHPRLILLERRLELAERKSAHVATQKLEPATTPPAEATAPPRPVASDVPAPVVELFTRRVQPVLVNNCTAGGCHQVGGSEPFQLDRALLHGMANRRSTMQNLAAALALVDRQRPQLSPLLTVPREAHGGTKEPIFGPRQEQAFEHLVGWVALVTQADKPDPAEPAVGPSAIRLTTAEETAPAAADFPPPAAAGDAAAEGPLGASVDDSAGGAIANAIAQEELLPLAATPRPTRFGAQLEKWRPRDPFDPEIFNRRQARRRSSYSPPPRGGEDDR